MQSIKRLSYRHILASHVLLNPLLYGLLPPHSTETAVLKVTFVTKSPLSQANGHFPSPHCATTVPQQHRTMLATSAFVKQLLLSAERCTKEKPPWCKGQQLPEFLLGSSLPDFGFCDPVMNLYCDCPFGVP